VNTTNTIAMAKLGNDPDSATSQFFINLANNDSNLDLQNGGFTVFARVRQHPPMRS
jgi:peptidyl-prolyl cis-trans isomerase A (cyclophilin A)